MVTLETAKHAFDAWRESKPNINTPTPVGLWEMVEQLLPRHKKGELCKALGISSHQIQSNCITNETVENQTPAPPQAIGDFVEATPPSRDIGIAELTLTGESRSLHLSLPSSALSEVLPMLGSLL